AKVEELDQWMASVKAAPVIEKTKDNMMFFRGGYGHANGTRGGTLDPTVVPGVGQSVNGVAVGSLADKDAWYMGAGFDFSLNNNLFGLMDNTEVLAELMFDYKELGRKGQNGLSAQEVGVVNTLGFNLPAANTKTATVNQFTLAASPKVKFMKGSAFRPWIIPVGLEINVISPPSDAITVLSPGMQFGLGADYKIWKDLYIGADARYHQQLGSIDGVRTNGVTAGGYLGLGF
ncbi:MAG: porin family protein, partial [Methylococcales bacterium]